MKENRMNIYVGNISYAATEAELEKLFQKYGTVASAAIIRDRDDGRSKGFGFVEMENQEDGERAIEALDGQEMGGRPLKVNPARPRRGHEPARERRERQPRDRLQRPSPSESESSPDGTFHNPYTFVPSLPRDEIKAGEFPGDFDPLKNKLDHSSLQAELWTGHIPIKLTTVTPLVLLKGDGKERDSTRHQKYDVLDYIPESSLRGMLRNVYEVVTNSRYACFRNNDHLAYRMIPQESLKLIPAIIENGQSPGKLVAYLYPGTSGITPQRPRGPMYAAMLTRYHRNPNANSVCVEGYNPKTGDEVWAEIDSFPHRRGYQYWKAIKVWEKSKHPTKPATIGHIVKGRVLITNENMGNKHDERIFFVDGENAKNPIKRDVTHLKEAWRMRIQSYRNAHAENDIFGRSQARNKPWRKIGRDPGDTAWSPHLYEDGKHKDRWGRDVHDALKLQAGDMVYARCEFDGNGQVSEITDLFPVMISRELYENSPEDLLGASLQPAKELNELSPADRLFGWVPQQKQNSNQENQGGYKSRIRIVCDDGPRSCIVKRFGDDGIPLTILGQPKPAQGRFYVAKDDSGTPQDDRINKTDAGYNKPNKKGLRGRKQYWHHRGLEAENASNYWDPSAEDQNQEYLRTGGKRDTQNRSIKGWIEPRTEFKASLYVQNLQPEEVGALLWLLTLPERHYFKLGYGKPLGFGSMKMEIDEERFVNGCMPLGTGEDWKAYYADLNASSPARLDGDRQNECIQKFRASMVAAYNPLLVNHATDDGGDKNEASSMTSLDQLARVKSKLLNTPEGRAQLEEQRFEELSFIGEFLQILRGPVGDAPIHYPRPNPKPDPEGKNFEWFVANEKQSKRSLPKVTDKNGLPYQP